MKRVIMCLWNRIRCKYCGKDCESVGSGAIINNMCERCYENGGDEE